MFVAGQDPGEEIRVIVPRRGRVDKEYAENFPGRGCPVLPKCTSSCQSLQIPRKNVLK